MKEDKKSNEESKPRRTLPWMKETESSGKGGKAHPPDQRKKRGRPTDSNKQGKEKSNKAGKKQPEPIEKVEQILREEREQFLERKAEFQDVASKYFEWWRTNPRTDENKQDEADEKHVEDENQNFIVVENQKKSWNKEANYKRELTRFLDQHERVIVFDLETTGFGPNDEIVEIGAVEIIQGKRSGQLFQAYCKPRSAIVHPMAYLAHHLSDQFLTQFEEAQVVIPRFLRWVGESPLLGHNLAFDSRMMQQELDRLNIPYSPRSGLCTMSLTRFVYPSLSSYSLGSVSSFLRLDPGFHRLTHGALIDAELTCSVFLLIIQNISI